MLDNRMEGRDTAVVRLQVRIVSSAGAAAAVRTADPRRAEFLVWGSVLLFGSVAFISLARIRRALGLRASRSRLRSWPMA